MTCHQNVGTFAEMLVIIQINVNRDHNENVKEKTWNRDVCCCANNIKIKQEKRRASHGTHRATHRINLFFFSFFHFLRLLYFVRSYLLCLLDRALCKHFQRECRYFPWVKNGRLFHLHNITDQQRKILFPHYFFFVVAPHWNCFQNMNRERKMQVTKWPRAIS